MTEAASPSPANKTQPLLSEAEAQMRTELYLQQRLDYQDDYYERRIEEFSYNSDRMLWVSALLMGVSTIISAYSVQSNQPLYAFITALLPAVATALSAFRALYQWQRQAQLYEDTWLALQQARLILPDANFIQAGDYAMYFPELVRQTEEVLRAEAGQWGQLERVETQSATGAPPPPAPGAPSRQPAVPGRPREPL